MRRAAVGGAHRSTRGISRSSSGCKEEEREEEEEKEEEEGGGAGGIEGADTMAVQCDAANLGASVGGKAPGAKDTKSGGRASTQSRELLLEGWWANKGFSLSVSFSSSKI